MLLFLLLFWKQHLIIIWWHQYLMTSHATDYSNPRPQSGWVLNGNPHDVATPEFACPSVLFPCSIRTETHWTSNNPERIAFSKNMKATRNGVGQVLLVRLYRMVRNHNFPSVLPIVYTGKNLTSASWSSPASRTPSVPKRRSLAVHAVDLQDSLSCNT